MNTEETARLVWFKSSYSGNEGGECVEVAIAPGAVHVRDSKELTGDQLAFGHEEWTAFVRYAVAR
jgi:hypothetical protein